MMIQKIIALLALLSSLTGCAGADALSPAGGGENTVPWTEPAPPIIAEADAVPADGARTEESDSVFPTEETASDTEDGAHNSEDSASHTEDGGTDSMPVETPADSLAEGSVTADTTALYTLFSPYSGQALQPRDDYGALLPYVGGTAGNGGYILRGLVTDDGQVVTDPVYAYIKSYGPFLLLYKTVKERRDGEAEIILCGKDGSWTMEADHFHHSILLDGIGMAAALNDGAVIILASDGVITHTFPRAQLEKYLGAGYSWDDDCREVCYAGGPIAICRWDEDSPYGNGASYDCFIDPVTGDITGEPPAGFAPENGFGEPEEEPTFPGYDYPDRIEDIATGTVYYWCERDHTSDLLDSRGNVLMTEFFTPGQGGLWEPVIGAGLVGTIKDGAFQFAKISSGEVVFRYPLKSWPGPQN